MVLVHDNDLAQLDGIYASHRLILREPRALETNVFSSESYRLKGLLQDVEPKIDNIPFYPGEPFDNTTTDVPISHESQRCSPNRSHVH